MMHGQKNIKLENTSMSLLKYKDKFPAIVSLPFLSIIMLATNTRYKF